MDLSLVILLRFAAAFSGIAPLRNSTVGIKANALCQPSNRHCWIVQQQQVADEVFAGQPTVTYVAGAESGVNFDNLNGGRVPAGRGAERHNKVDAQPATEGTERSSELAGGMSDQSGGIGFTGNLTATVTQLTMGGASNSLPAWWQDDGRSVCTLPNQAD